MNSADMHIEEIKMVQRSLSEVMNRDLVDNGHYGHYSERMVKEFQEKFGLKIDGIFNEICWNTLKGKFLKKLNNFTIFCLEQVKKKLINTFIDEKTLKMMEIEETKKIQKEIQNKASAEAMTNIENKLRKDPIHD